MKTAPDALPQGPQGDPMILFSISPDLICMIMKNEGERKQHKSLFPPGVATSTFSGAFIKKLIEFVFRRCVSK